MKITFFSIFLFITMKGFAQPINYILVDTIEADFYLVYAFNEKINNDEVSTNAVFVFNNDNVPNLNKLSDVYNNADGVAIRNKTIIMRSDTIKINEITYNEFKVEDVVKQNNYIFNILKVKVKFIRVIVKQPVLVSLIDKRSDKYLYTYLNKNISNLNSVILYLQIKS